MTKQDRLRLRAALSIHERLKRNRKPSLPPLLPRETWQDLSDAGRRLGLVEQRGWESARQAAQRDFRRLAAAFSDRLAEGVRQLVDDSPSSRIQSPRDILADLAALEEEFVEVGIDLRERTLSLTTNAILLEGVDLGRFRILLHWDLLPDAGAYDVVPLDPNQAASDETTSHPHVRDEGLCEGEGRLPIRRALQEGRLYDFGLLVRQVLETYNAGSAYVPLSRWSGRPCSDCGYTGDEDGITNCDCCDSDLCFDCHVSCSGCGRSCCGECRERCPGCDESFCTACLPGCPDCDETRCRGCLTNGRCDHCHQIDEEAHARNDETANEEPATSVLPAEPATLAAV